MLKKAYFNTPTKNKQLHIQKPGKNWQPQIYTQIIIGSLVVRSHWDLIHVPHLNIYGPVIYACILQTVFLCNYNRKNVKLIKHI